MPNWRSNPMRAREKRTLAATLTSEEDGGARALAGCVKVVTAFNALLTAGVFALAVAWELALPAAGCALAFVVSAFMLKGGAA